MRGAAGAGEQWWPLPDAPQAPPPLAVARRRRGLTQRLGGLLPLPAPRLWLLAWAGAPAALVQPSD